MSLLIVATKVFLSSWISSCIRLPSLFQSWERRCGHHINESFARCVETFNPVFLSKIMISFLWEIVKSNSNFTSYQLYVVFSCNLTRLRCILVRILMLRRLRITGRLLIVTLILHQNTTSLRLNSSRFCICQSSWLVKWTWSEIVSYVLIWNRFSGIWCVNSDATQNSSSYVNGISVIHINDSRRRKMCTVSSTQTGSVSILRVSWRQ